MQTVIYDIQSTTHWKSFQFYQKTIHAGETGVRSEVIPGADLIPGSEEPSQARHGNQTQQTCTFSPQPLFSLFVLEQFHSSHSNTYNMIHCTCNMKHSLMQTMLYDLRKPWFASLLQYSKSLF